MDTGPCGVFGERPPSFELADEHRLALVKDASEMLRENPETEIVGLFLDGEAGEAEAFRLAIERATGQSLEGKGFLGVAPRYFVASILRRDAPASLEWLPASTTRADDGEVQHWLPLAAMTRNGIRFGAVELAE